MSKFKSKSIADLKQKLKRSIYTKIDRSQDLPPDLEKVDLYPVSESTSQDPADRSILSIESSIEKCRDCPEGMQW